MTAKTLPRTQTTATPSAHAPATGFGHTVHAEWIKFWTVRSTIWALFATVVVMVGIATLAAWGSSTAVVNGGSGPMNTAQLLSAGYQVGQLAVAVLGVLTIAGEYSTGMVRSTLTAVPRRGSVLAAKALVLSAVVFAVSVVSMVLSYVATMPWHAPLHASLDLTDAETLRMTVGLPLYLVGIALLSFVIGALVRHSAGALTAVIALLLVVENVLMIIPLRAIETLSPYLPSTAGRRVMMDAEALSDMNILSSTHLAPWLGLAVLFAWVLALGAVAVVLLQRRDA